MNNKYNIPNKIYTWKFGNGKPDTMLSDLKALRKAHPDIRMKIIEKEPKISDYFPKNNIYKGENAWEYDLLVVAGAQSYNDLEGIAIFANADICPVWAEFLIGDDLEIISCPKAKQKENQTKKAVKSKKDAAFEQERIKFRRQIRELSAEKKEVDKEAEGLRIKLDAAEENIRQQKEWIDRLLEYTDLSENEMQAIVEIDKTLANATEKFSTLESILHKYGSGIFR